MRFAVPCQAPSSFCLYLLLLICFASLCCLVTANSDFYELLGVDRNANDREIRKAFKKLALQFHPDKNKDDAEAHDKFVEINRAYEVLKDEDLRKKYDLYGEKGIDGSGGGQQYQSWNFYKNQFGIYDDDKEIVTLNRADFEQSVLHNADIWFVNFYSTFCSHCHDLAPTWRQLAQEMEGVIRIGAVNCQEDWMLCREQGIMSYPSLVMYPQRQKYNGPRTKSDLVDYVLKFLNAEVLQLGSDIMTFKSNLPLVVDYCSSESSEDCLSVLSRQKLAVVLKDLMTVASVNCAKMTKACEKIGLDSGVYYFEDGKISRENAKDMESLDAKELAFSLLGLLPDTVEYDESQFQKLRQDISQGRENPWLIEFVGQSVERELELRKLPVLLIDIRVGRINCSKCSSVCKSLFIHKFPTFAVFKNNGGYEFHHGRASVHDIAGFARDSTGTNVRVLVAEDLSLFTLSGQAWFVDFFTPWCPPCMRLLPEFRKAARILGTEINFGTVDCTLQQGLCQQVNINQYPTTIFYNLSQPHPFIGLHNVDELVSFVEDVKNPPVIALTPQSFQKSVLERPDEEIWLIDFFAPWCGPCMELAPEYRKVAKLLKEFDFVRVASVDCQQHTAVCQQNHVQGYPTIRIFPANGRQAADYNNWFRDAQNIRNWVFQFFPNHVEEIDATRFQEALKSQVPSLVDFYAPWCGHCQIFAPEFEKIAKALKDLVTCVKVNCDIHPSVCHSAGVRAYPTLKFYSGAQNGKAQSALGFDINSQDSQYIIKFLTGQLGVAGDDKQKTTARTESRDEL